MAEVCAHFLKDHLSNSWFFESLAEATEEDQEKEGADDGDDDRIIRNQDQRLLHECAGVCGKRHTQPWPEPGDRRRSPNSGIVGNRFTLFKKMG